MKKKEDEKKTGVCDECFYSRPSFNLLYCSLKQKPTTAQETCHGFESKYEPEEQDPYDCVFMIWHLS